MLTMDCNASDASDDVVDSFKAYEHLNMSTRPDQCLPENALPCNLSNAALSKRENKGTWSMMSHEKHGSWISYINAVLSKLVVEHFYRLRGDLHQELLAH